MVWGQRQIVSFNRGKELTNENSKLKWVEKIDSIGSGYPHVAICLWLYSLVGQWRVCKSFFFTQFHLRAQLEKCCDLDWTLCLPELLDVRKDHPLFFFQWESFWEWCHYLPKTIGSLMRWLKPHRLKMIIINQCKTMQRLHNKEIIYRFSNRDQCLKHNWLSRGRNKE